MEETNLSLAQKVKLKPISEIVKKLGLKYEDIEPIGHHKAKIPLKYIDPKKLKKNKLILVTAMTPTPKGEGKTTTSVGLSEALNSIGKKSVLALREPSLGPVFGIKGGATGGGNAQVLPMEDINLHFTGDFSAIEKANNLIAAMIDNFIQNAHTNPELTPKINPLSVTWKRVMDSNDRYLRNIISGLGGKNGGVPSETGFNITAASEIMAILCLCESIDELKERIGNIYIGDTYSGEGVFVKDLKIQGAVALLLKDAIKPNLVQTTEGNPALIHGGPFANIAHGCSSLLATKMAMSLGDYTVTEAGFGSDLGAEKFVNIKCQYGKLSPDAIVMVATLRAVKHHGEEKGIKNPHEIIERGFSNLKRHIENTKNFGVPLTIAINKFKEDSEEELQLLLNLCEQQGVKAFICDVWWQGSKGALNLAQHVVELADQKSNFKFSYSWDLTIEEKIKTIAKDIYKAKRVNFTPTAYNKLKKIESLGLNQLPVCIAKTPASFTDDPKIKNIPSEFILSIRDFEIASGAGFIVPLAGTILRMPGLPKVPAAIHMDIDNDGSIKGLN